MEKDREAGARDRIIAAGGRVSLRGALKSRRVMYMKTLY